MDEAKVRPFASIEADRRLTVVETVLHLHVEQCDRRAQMAQRLMWFVATINVAMLGALLKIVLQTVGIK